MALEVHLRWRENFFRISWRKILYQATGVSTGKISPHLHGKFASFDCSGNTCVKWLVHLCFLNVEI